MKTGRQPTKNTVSPPHIISRYQLRVKVLEQAESIEDLYPIRSLHYEVL